MQQVIESAEDVNHLWLLLVPKQVLKILNVVVQPHSDNGHAPGPIAVSQPQLLENCTHWYLQNGTQSFAGDTPVVEFTLLYKSPQHRDVYYEQTWRRRQNQRPCLVRNVRITPDRAQDLLKNNEISAKEAQIKDTNGNTPQWLITRHKRIRRV